MKKTNFQEEINKFKSVLTLKIQAKIKQINEQIEIAEEEKDLELKERLIEHRRTVRRFSNTNLENINSIDQLELPFELSVDITKFSVI